eukprot:9495012-Pyramimonas_sp.AAC.1
MHHRPPSAPTPNSMKWYRLQCVRSQTHVAPETYTAKLDTLLLNKCLGMCFGNVFVATAQEDRWAVRSKARIGCNMEMPLKRCSRGNAAKRLTSSVKYITSVHESTSWQDGEE